MLPQRRIIQPPYPQTIGPHTPLSSRWYQDLQPILWEWHPLRVQFVQLQNRGRGSCFGYITPKHTKHSMRRIFLGGLLCLLTVTGLFAQSGYRYHINLNTIEKDRLQVELATPTVQHTQTHARTFTHFVVKRKIIIMLNSHSSLAGCHATPGIRTSVAHGPPLGTVRITSARLFGVGTVQHYQGCHTAVSLLEGTKASLWQRSVALAAHANGTRSVITSRCASLAIGVHCEFGQPHKSTQFVNY